MKISTKGRYGLRALVDLAIHQKNGFVSLTSIAHRQDLSLNYLENIFSSLKKAGLVVATAGLQGGYMLSIPPSEITLQRILTVLEGDLCVSSVRYSSEKTLFEDFLNREVFDNIGQNIQKILQNTTLQDIITESEKQMCIRDRRCCKCRCAGRNTYQKAFRFGDFPRCHKCFLILHRDNLINDAGI